jgi:hypothetical protein
VEVWRGASNTTPQQLRRFAVEHLYGGDVATMHRHELETELPDASESESLSWDDKWKRMEETVWKVATNTIVYTRKQAGKEWFDEEKNACRAKDEREQRTANNR